jgi:hypothetical protein
MTPALGCANVRECPPKPSDRASDSTGGLRFRRIPPGDDGWLGEIQTIPRTAQKCLASSRLGKRD